MRNGLTVLAVVCALCCAPFAFAQDELNAKLQADAIGSIKSGTYLAGDSVKFSLDGYGHNRFLLRVSGDPEIYVLYSDRASLGGRILKYDNGATAVSIASWGGVTLYTDNKPGGLPAVRTGDSAPPTLSAVTLTDIQNASEDEVQHLTYARRLKIAVVADWDDLASNPRDRALAFDVMENTVRGIDRFSLNAQARVALTSRIDTLKITTTGGRPTAEISGKALVVTYNRGQGYAGRASSRAIARALGLLLKVKTPN